METGDWASQRIAQQDAAKQAIAEYAEELMRSKKASELCQRVAQNINAYSFEQLRSLEQFLDKL